ncbi:cardiolipin synthase [Undibacterium sp. CY18W]|uniref:Cardiolipin synthase n=1 Tax=Undibacterium hunanense TaxID=2762292 RepID=A0ABR6ZWJ1_9BURK|nr:cardiolipin synthase [Undibacterium hunanense]MBC3919988.1 cardiolipin synthase [Undibacterium hunanense]
MVRQTKAIRLAVPLTAVLLLNACATLPEINYLDASAVDSAGSNKTAPTVKNAKGILSDKKTVALMRQRWKNFSPDQAAQAVLEESVTGSPLISGNQVTLLFDGPQTMAAMMDAIKKAKSHIHLETYIFDQDELGTAFSDLLIAQQQAGIQVSIIYDSVGTIGTPQSFFDKMQAAGIQMLAFNPVNPTKLNGPWRPNRRDHRKILIVDGEVAFTGGVNISASYANSSLFRSKNKDQAAVGWRDTHIKIEGPAVAAIQWVFLDTWTNAGDAPLPEKSYFPPLQNRGNKMVRVLASEPEGNPAIYKAYMLAIQEASTSIHITSAYFVPDAQILKALIAAAKRGVDVKIIMPGVTDSGLVFHAGQSFYTEMLEAGIKIYELQIAVLHAKTAVIDQVWSTVGSTNIDTRSFLHNKEINVVVIDTEFALSMENAFNEDLRLSREIQMEQWQQRPVTTKLKEWLARRFEYWL